jgi:hypothetical protein
MRARKKWLYSTLALAVTLLVTAVLTHRALADEHPRRAPGGPPDLPPETAPEASKPLVERYVRVVRQHDGENVADGFGWIGAQLDDLNGDGVNEYLVTAPFYESFTTHQGRAYVYDGASGVLLAVHTGEPFEWLGYSGGDAGDVNNDGIPDYIVGAVGIYQLEITGRATVYSGADHSVLHEWSGVPADRFGASVTGVGDVNGDGYGDVLVGAEFDGAQQSVADAPGRVTVFSGQDGSVLWTQAGFNRGDGLGSGAGRVADLNGDGVPDVVAAASGADGGNGRAYVFSGVDGTVIHTLAPAEPGGAGTYGRFFASGAGDTDGDGLDDIYVGDYAALGGDGRAYVYSGASGEPIHTIAPELPGAGLGPGRGIPDVNGDGHDDLIVGAWTSDAGTPTGGRVSIYSGADGSMLQDARGAVAENNLGVDALPLGDLNGDGRPEYMLTAVGLDFIGQDVGYVYIVTFLRPAG